MTLVISGTYSSGIVLTGSRENPATVTAGSTIASNGSYAVYGSRGYAWLLTNDGVLSANAFGVTLASGGSVVNAGGASPATISGGVAGVSISGAYGYVANTGTIIGSKTQSSGVWLGDGGSVLNGSARVGAATIEGSYVGVNVSAAAGYVLNRGTVLSTATSGFGVRMQAGGTVTNLAGPTGPGLIQGETGVLIYGGGGSVSNYGRIASTGAYGTYGVSIQGAGTISNGGRKTAYGLISGGVELAYGSVVNYGTIDGLSLHHRGVYGTELAGFLSVTNSGTITGNEAIHAAGAVRAINGSSTDTVALLKGRDFGVFSGGGGAVLNSATIEAPIGVLMFAAGAQSMRVVNGATAATTARIDGSQVGVYLRFYGVPTGNGQMEVTNYGRIAGKTDGVVMADQGGGMTLINGGTISGVKNKGGVAVQFLGGDAVLAVTPSGKFIGQVLASSNGDNILDFTSAASAGKVTGIGTEFVGFQNVWLDPQAQWTISGANTMAAGSGITLHGQSTVTVGGTLDFGGNMNFAGTGALVVARSGRLEVGTAGGAASGVITVDAGNVLTGFGTVATAITDNGVVKANGGTLTLLGRVSGSGVAAITVGAVLQADGPFAPTRINFLSGAGTLQLAAGVDPTAPIGGFGAAAGNGIELLGEHVSALEYTSLSSSTGVLTATIPGGADITLSFAGGSYKTSQFHAANALGGNATIITFG